MASNYDGTEMELGEVHKHSDGESSAEVTQFHGGKMTAGPGSSEEAYPGASKTDEKEVTDSPVQDSEASTGTPKVNDGRAVGQ